MLLVPEKMRLQSPMKNIQTVHSENIGGQFVPYVRYSHAESTTDVCSLSSDVPYSILNSFVLFCNAVITYSTSDIALIIAITFVVTNITV